MSQDYESNNRIWYCVGGIWIDLSRVDQVAENEGSLWTVELEASMSGEWASDNPRDALYAAVLAYMEETDAD